MDVVDAIRTRKSIRRFKPDEIPDDVLSDVLDAFRMAPSWANTQCWELIVIRDVETKEKISEEVLAPKNPAKRGVAEAPVVVVALAMEKISGFYESEPRTDKGDWFMYDVGVAMQNLCLAAWGKGLGTVHVGLMDAKKAEDILGVPEGVRVVALTPLGYPAKEGAATKRKEFSDFVYKEGYGKK
jgi:nitroreductase